MVLCTHDGAGVDDVSVARPHSLLASFLEGDLIKKLFPRMIFSGLFERHPNLTLMLTELQRPASSWWTQTGQDVRRAVGNQPGPAWCGQVPDQPSEYIASNVFLGQSYLHALPSEVAIAVRDGYAANFTWGSDYPHQEGVYRHPDPDETETRVQLGLRNAFSRAPADLARAWWGRPRCRSTASTGSGWRGSPSGSARSRRVGWRRPWILSPEEWAILARSQTVFPEYHLANPEPGTSSADESTSADLASAGRKS